MEDSMLCNPIELSDTSLRVNRGGDGGRAFALGGIAVAVNAGNVNFGDDQYNTATATANAYAYANGGNA
jgi:hypothetical protein